MISTFPALGLRGAKGMRFMLLATLAAGVLSMNAGRGTLAYFTTQVTSTGNTFTAGNLRFTLDDTNNNPSNAQSLTSSIKNLYIAPTKSTQAPLRVNNAGSLAAKYGIKVDTSAVGTDGDLSGALKLTIKAATAANTGGFTGCATATLPATSDANWTDLGVNGVTLPANGTANRVTLIDVAGTQARNLAASTGNEVLCVHVSWPDGTPANDNLFNSQTSAKFSTNVNFTFDGLVQ